MLLLNAITALFSITALAAPASLSINEPRATLKERASPIRIHLSSNPKVCLGSWFHENGGPVQLVKCTDPASKLRVEGDMFRFGAPPGGPTCLDVAKGDPTNPAQNWECNPDNPNQQFVWYGSGTGSMNFGWRGPGQYCLTVTPSWIYNDGPVLAGQNVGFTPCDPNDSLQKWEWSEYWDF
ncbi:hypothetical protein CcaverHIS002_0702850 [Cutaneotrichosporon cavernicola]|uniref:Ricin B lectin domain-containing protein n=1 Tax=Cutaneotrichosporon cavernicola TaxID=279322 RepID=A0AA48QYM9_9TREE|nr:uncharacterized protein CcaverHIS019_0702930 [Cutaneotrichosporon cavernicola]BEI86939.1 hypothetical protein CcaverHIS002_0702850 [Cutaneotrichosporon cavernicola]BEI94712.1 hypothetical protein CcaverHIS019_0702930 [Cutaneotrichosporon cavernicola]BEJ02487.1 hypothetical protein CcaverHIS631_0702820 [Cutaneotrichosporon cavernicola]BEJ10245.1 hypothetical protein CcaverHIS641_0702800 [Cutaneotrichosporon cavernicola]